jgi:FkbM family methyltransferase
MPMLVRAAIWWNRYGITGKSAIPRMIGRFWKGQDLFIHTRHGGLLSVDPSNLDVYARIYNLGGHWDSHVMQACEHVLRSGDVYYDIGANAGVFAIDAAMSIPNLTVYAFEPQPTLAEHIRRSILANGLQHVRCVELMLGQEEGEKPLYMTSHSIHASIVPRERVFHELSRPMKKLDSLVFSKEIAPPDVIKIDVEGAETMVFEGARQTLEQSSPSVIFEADENLLRIGLKVTNVFDSLLKAVPYKFYGIDVEGNLSAAQAPFSFGNYLALSPRHFDRIESDR